MPFILATWPRTASDRLSGAEVAIMAANSAHRLATPKEVAGQLDIAPSTLRAWSKHFASQLSTDANPPKEASGRVARRLYRPSDVGILERAKGLLASGLPYDRVLAILQTEPEPQPLATIPRPGALALPELAQALQVIADQRQRLDDLEASRDDLERRVLDLEQDRRPFWRRWL